MDEPQEIPGPFVRTGLFGGADGAAGDLAAAGGAGGGLVGGLGHQDGGGAGDVLVVVPEPPDGGAPVAELPEERVGLGEVGGVVARGGAYTGCESDGTSNRPLPSESWVT